MNDTPTPETDALISVGLENADRECVPADFARKLERERDEARRAFVIATDQMVVAQCKLRESNKERDEAREALASREVVIAQQNVITDLILERDGARLVLQEIEAARWHTACELRRIATRALGNLTIPTK
jgi:predicted house-cleaning NTP pyrophosphatase (Maf/HAM1 superfamily)